MLSQAISALTSIAMLALKPALVVVGVMLALLAVGLCKSWRAHRRVVSKRTREGSQLLDAVCGRTVEQLACRRCAHQTVVV